MPMSDLKDGEMTEVVTMSSFLSLYEIGAKLETAIDFETGEILIPEEEFDSLVEKETDGIKYFMALSKNMRATAKALTEEKKAIEDTFTSRIKAAERIADHAEYVLSNYLKGEKYESEVGTISWRKSTVVDVNEEQFLQWDGRMDYLDYTPKIKKEDIKRALKAGELIPGCQLNEKNNMQIK